MASRDFSYGSIEIDVDKVLGVGSYGKVCKAKCGQLPCAAKLLHDTLFQDNDPGTNTLARRFEQECQFLSNIKHPNIVQYLGTMRDLKSHRPVLLMELMDESLTRFLERSTLGLPYHSQLNICHDVALALAYLHSNTIIHRDLSSNNVLLIGEGSRAKVTDFGMSKLAEMNTHLTPLTQCPGNSAYMPPEALITPPHYSSKLDIFSHGVLTIQIITRNFPNPGDASKFVKDPNYPTGRVLVHFPEADRRKNDIDLIEADHPFLPTALHCIKDIDTERPSADELCEGLASLKSSARYRDSVVQTSPAQRLQLQLEAKEQELQREREDHQGELQREREDHQRELQREREIHQGELQRGSENHQEELQKEREDHQGELQREREDHQRELQREREAYQRKLKQVIGEYQAQHQQKLQKISNSLKTEKERLTAELRDSRAREQQYREELEAMRSQTALRGPKKIKAGNSKKVSLDSERSTAKPVASQTATPLTLTWRQGEPAPVDISSEYGAAVVHGNTAYFSWDYSVYSYTLPEDKWTQLQQCQHEKFSLAVINDKLTTIGGYTSNWTATNSLLSLTTTKGWKELLPPMQKQRTWPATVTTTTHLVVAGGQWRMHNLSIVEVMDTDTLQWSTASSLPQNIGHPLMTLCGGYLYISNSKSNTVFSCSVEGLLQSCQPPSDKSTSTNSSSKGGSAVWTRLADIPVHHGSILATLGGHMLAIGGYKGGQSTGVIHCYNRATNSWEVTGKMSTPRCKVLAAVLPSNELIVVGGEEDLITSYCVTEICKV